MGWRWDTDDRGLRGGPSGGEAGALHPEVDLPFDKDSGQRRQMGSLDSHQHPGPGPLPESWVERPGTFNKDTGR